MPLEDSLLQQILEAQNQTNLTLGAHTSELTGIRRELAQRLTPLETDVAALKISQAQVNGARKLLRYLVDAGIAVASALGYHHLRK